MTRLIRVFFVLLASALAVPAAAQSPTTSTLVGGVVDQTAGVVSDANVTVVNNATGASRQAVSGSDGTATVAALALTGTYNISVTKAGFTADEVKNLTLQAGESATVKVKLVASG